MEKVYLGLGSNLGDSGAIFRAVLNDMQQHAQINIIHLSSLYRTAPLDNSDQPDYLNAVVEIHTSLAPHALLRMLQSLEQKYGRIRTADRWSARTLDLDILVFGANTIATDDLTIPHYGIKDRDFVLYPLVEIAPELEIPLLGSITTLIAQCTQRGMELVGKIQL